MARYSSRNSTEELIKYAKKAHDEGVSYGELQAREYAKQHPINKLKKNYKTPNILTSHSKVFAPLQKDTEE